MSEGLGAAYCLPVVITVAFTSDLKRDQKAWIIGL